MEELKKIKGLDESHFNLEPKKALFCQPGNIFLSS